MIGKQANFYMLPEDEQQFLSFVLANPAVALLESWSHEVVPRHIPDPIQWSQAKPKCWDILLWHTELPGNKPHMRRVEVEEYRTELAAYVKTGEIRYVVDKDNGPVIELTVHW
jgi:hypothetical protein